MTKSCCLCSQISGDARADLLAAVLCEPRELPFTDRIIQEWNDFVLFPSIGALTAGHVLLCPKVHVRSMAALPGELDVSLRIATEAVQALLRGVFGLPVHSFEHGNGARGSRVVCTVDHAHLHFIPADVSIEKHLSRYQWIESKGSLAAITQGHEYLFYEEPSAARWVTSGDGSPFPSQYLRRAFAEELGIADRWNWHDVPAADITRDTLRVLRAAM